MARIRSVKPALRTSAVVAAWPREVRYAFVLLWGYLDDKGRGLDVPKGIAGDLFPLDDDVTPKKMDTWLTMMTRGFNGRPGPVCRYEVAGRRYLHTVNVQEHQRPNRPTPSVLPPCPLHEPPDGDSLSGSLSPSPHPPDSVGESPLSPRVLELDSRNLTDGDGPSVASLPQVAADKPRRGTRIPDDFEPTAEMVAWARTNAPTTNRTDHEAFVDYWRGRTGKDATKADWPATWRNWMRREHERRANGARASPTNARYVPYRNPTDASAYHGDL